MVDKASSTDFDVFFVDGQIMALVIEGMAFPSIRGILKYGADNGFITVDMGAVPYVANGADIMAPGVVDADPGVNEGDLVWIRDEKNLRPLAIGRALMPGPAMMGSKSGKAVETIHYVGDKLWRYDEE
jgi:PUA-domain protein